MGVGEGLEIVAIARLSLLALGDATNVFDVFDVFDMSDVFDLIVSCADAMVGEVECKTEETATAG
jgi:hypothetical protein